MKTFKVAATPTDAMTLTNIVYVPPGVISGLKSPMIEVSGYVFRIAEDALVSPGHVAFNARQRNTAKLSTAGDSISLTPFDSSRLSRLSLVKLELELSTRPTSMTSRFVVDATALTNTLHELLTGHPLTVGQCLVTAFENRKLVATVRSLEGEKSFTEFAERPTQGLVKSDTVLLLTRNQNHPIALENFPQGLEPENASGLFPDGFSFDKTEIGGLAHELEEIFRRAFESRLYPQSVIRKLKTRHVKGLLLHGPPGTGKTLIARRLASMLGCTNLTIVNGPELFDKYVGQTESNIRSLFSAAEAEQKQHGEDSSLHIIVFDEFDAMVKTRGSTRDGTGVHDSAVNQLLSKIDGPEELNNVLLIAMTNRKDLIDEAILRPGRFEVHIEIGIPDESGRLEIFQIKTKSMARNGVLHSDVDLSYLASITKNYTGAEIEGIVNNAASFATHRHVDMANPTKFKNPDDLRVTQRDFENAIETYIPALGVAVNELDNIIRHGFLDYGVRWERLLESCMSYVRTLEHATRLHSLSILLEGENGTGKSSLAAYISKLSHFPCIKLLSPINFVGYSELAKCNAIRQTFEDADRSPLSVIILDDLERIIEFVPVGMRFSHAVLQTLLVLLKRSPSKDHKLLIIGTTSHRDLLHQLELAQSFDATCDVEPLQKEEVKTLWTQLNVRFLSQAEREHAEQLLPAEIPLKKLLLLVERARSLVKDGTSDTLLLKAENFAAALR